MHIIKLDAIDSTNSYLKRLFATDFLEDYTAVTALSQTHGRGQMGAVWTSQASKNLMCSVFKDLTEFKSEHAFYISIVTSLALLKTLKSLEIPRLSVKWPNDILSEDKKICGVLIENVIKQNRISASFIGFGLNVNQTEFENLPRASSLILISGKTFNLDSLTISILNNLKDYFALLKDEKYTDLKNQYETHLFRKNKPSTFKDTEGNMFSGFIIGVSDTGLLQVMLEDNVLKVFDLKEITLLY